MPNILINGLNLSTGGGKNILDNYLLQLSKVEHLHTYFVLTPDYATYSHYSNKHIKIVDVEGIYKINIFFIPLYFIIFPRLIKKLKIDLIFNFGDIVIPQSLPQIYFFDWAYAIYPEKYIWDGMKWKDKLIRRTKIFLINKYNDKASLIICQTSNIADRLKHKYKAKKLIIIPTPLGLDMTINEYSNFDLPVREKYFIYPASYATHKNFKIILDLARLIKEKSISFLIIITIDEKIGAEFIKVVNEEKLDCILNLGKISSNQIPTLYNQCDALLFPSLLESYGLPYVEAMSLGKPILTSDLDFAHSVCGDVASYFNPFDAKSILQVMLNYDKDELALKKRINLGKVKVNSIPDWKEVYSKFEEEIDIILNQK